MTETRSGGATNGLTDDELRYLFEARVEAALGPQPAGPLELKALLRQAGARGSDPELLYEELVAERPATWAPAPPWADVDPGSAGGGGDGASSSGSGSGASPPPGGAGPEADGAKPPA